MPRKRRNRVWKTEEKGEEDQTDNIFGFKNYSIKKIILKVWGFYNENFKQSWENFTKQSDNIGELYFSTAILVDITCKYISRKKAKMAQDKEDEKKRKRNTKRAGWKEQGMDKERVEAVERYNLRLSGRMRKKDSSVSRSSNS